MAVWWIEYANLDALRVDTYFYMGYEGAQWTKSIRNEYPNMEFVGEVWGNDPGIISYWLGDRPKHDRLPAICLKRWISLWSSSLVMGLSNDNEAGGGSTKAIYNTIAQEFSIRRCDEFSGCLCR